MKNAKMCNNNEGIIRLQMKLKTKEEEWASKIKECEKKLEMVEKALSMKTKLLVEYLRKIIECLSMIVFIFKLSLLFKGIGFV